MTATPRRITLHLDGARLTAADDGSRTLTGMLVPYDEDGNTSIGRLRVRAGALTIPDDPADVILNTEHDQTRPIGRAARLTPTDDGITASFTVAHTRAGDDALEEAREGLRACLSVEVDNPVVRNGVMVGGLLAGAGHVVRPAFPSAQLVAADCGDVTLTDQEAHVPTETGRLDAAETITQDVETTYTDTETGETITVTEHHEETVDYTAPGEGAPAGDTGEAQDPADDEAQAADDVDDEDDPDATASAAADAAASTTHEEEATVPATATAASAPAGSLAANRPTPMTGAQGTGLRDLSRLMAAAHQRGGRSRMLAALSDVVPGDILGIEQPQFVGELWSGRRYQRRIIPLFGETSPLTSYKVKGWRWVVKPEVDTYAGNKTDIPSNSPQTEAVEVDAARLAGGHDIDRKFYDFNDTEFIASYWAAMTESYAIKSDAAVYAAIEDAATEVTGQGGLPDGVAEGWGLVIDGALAVLEATTKEPATFALVDPALYRGMLLTRSQDVLEYLSAALGLSQGEAGAALERFTLLPWSDVPAGSVLVGTRAAVTVHELGGSPIRVEALDIAKGGVDDALFGYYAVNIHDEGGLALVSSES